MTSPTPISSRIKGNEAKDRIWTAMRKKKTFTIPSLKKSVQKDAPYVQVLVESLVRSKHLNILQKPFNLRHKWVYELIDDTGSRRPNVDSKGRTKVPDTSQRMWMAMKALKRMTFKDLSLATMVSDERARGYLKALRRAGYLRSTQQGVCAAVYTYIPSKDTGFKAPLIRVDGSVYDQNTKKVVYVPAKEARNDL